MRPPQRCFSGDWKARTHGTLPIGIDYSRNWPTAPSPLPSSLPSLAYCPHLSASVTLSGIRALDTELAS